MLSIKNSARVNTRVSFAQSTDNCTLFKRITKLTFYAFASLLVASQLLIDQASAQTPPPNLGEETKGTPAIDETAQVPNVDATAPATKDQPESLDKPSSFLGTAKIKESRRENGQIYEIELDHSLGGKQYIQENDSDGKIESTSNDLEETPNLPKWKLGSW